MSEPKSLYTKQTEGMAAGMTDEQLQQVVATYKRKQLEKTQADTTKDLEERVYVNRSVSMDRIKYIGFDMDHTLVVYNSPDYEQLSFQLAMNRLVSIGYPQEILRIQYDPTFPLRGLFFDKIYGNLLKADQFGNILSCFHGFQSLSSPEIRGLYPNKYVQPTEGRIFILYTLFNLPEVFILSSLVDFFDNHPSYHRVTEPGPERYQGVKYGDVFISYQMLWQDIREAVEWMHRFGDLKERTLENLDKYVKKDPRLPLCLHKLRQSGRKTFIATNSEYHYTQKLMTYMFDFPHGPEPGTPHQNWKSYFDYILVDAKKPLFFAEGSTLREVDEESGSLKLGVFTGEIEQGKVFSGGSSDAFCKYTGAKGKEILYCGDHIFGDVIKAKKEQAWRTFLVLPELTDEIGVWEATKGLFRRLQNLEYILTEMYKNMTGHVTPNLPTFDSLRLAIKITAQEMENSYPSQLGSLLRCGSRLTHFAIQASRFADLYSSCAYNLSNYPMTYLFSAPHQLMAHETPPGEDLPLNPSPSLSGKILANRRVMGKLAKGMSIIDHDLDEDSTNGK